MSTRALKIQQDIPEVILDDSVNRYYSEFGALIAEDPPEYPRAEVLGFNDQVEADRMYEQYLMSIK